jgi:hypothetical protein
MPNSPQLIVACYVTRNRRCPFLGLIGHWPHRAGFYRMAMAGQRILVRPASREEREAHDNAVRHMATRWVGLLGFVRWHRQAFGKHGQAVLVAALRQHWSQVVDCLRDQRRKAARHARRRAALASSTSKSPKGARP